MESLSSKFVAHKSQGKRNVIVISRPISPILRDRFYYQLFSEKAHYLSDFWWGSCFNDSPSSLLVRGINGKLKQECIPVGMFQCMLGYTLLYVGLETPLQVWRGDPPTPPGVGLETHSQVWAWRPIPRCGPGDRPGCGPGDPLPRPSTSPWVWAWRPPHPRPDPSSSPWVWAWRPARHAGIPPCEQNHRHV